MKCPECRKLGQRSKVFFNKRIVQLLHTTDFWDEDGRLHVHDPNLVTASFSCSKGHRWSETERPVCPVKECEWNER